MYDPVYKQITEDKLIYRDINQISGSLGTRMFLQMAGKEELQRSKRTLWGMTSFPCLDCGDGSQSYNQNLSNHLLYMHTAHCTPVKPRLSRGCLCGGREGEDMKGYQRKG